LTRNRPISPKNQQQQRRSFWQLRAAALRASFPGSISKNDASECHVYASEVTQTTPYGTHAHMGLVTFPTHTHLLRHSNTPYQTYIPYAAYACLLLCVGTSYEWYMGWMVRAHMGPRPPPAQYPPMTHMALLTLDYLFLSMPTCQTTCMHMHDM
jgi:hypothetical protein